MPDAEVVFHQPPSDDSSGGLAGRLVDTPEARAALETLAIPRCAEWREANPEPDPDMRCCGGNLLAGTCRRCGSFNATSDACRDCGYGQPGDSASISVLADGHEPYCGGPATVAAPYCCSAYCPRCAGMRALDGVDPLTPNQWMEPNE